jgi:hypothetical protein
MSSPQNRTPVRRILVSGACAAALLLGPSAGLAAADDASLVETVVERSEQLAERENTLDKSLKALQRSPSLSRARTAGKDAGAMYRLTVTIRDEVRADDGSTDRGMATRDAVLPELTSVAAAAKKLDATLRSAIRKRSTSKAQVTKIVSAKLALDKAIGAALGTITEALADDGPSDPAPAPTDPTA